MGSSMTKEKFIVLHENDDCEGHLVEVTYYGQVKGPAQVSTESYRQNWENIFGGKTVAGQA